MVRGLRDINIAIVGAPKVGKTSSWVRSRARSKFRFRNIFLKIKSSVG
jgi:GTPase SAR1 family protein